MKSAIYFIVTTAIMLFCCSNMFAQKIDSIYFHLYTDSLKKGTYNYINVDGYLGNDKYLPLSEKEILFSANTGRWDGNSLIIDSSYKKSSVIVTATLKKNPSLTKTITIYIKTLPDNEALKSEEELLKEWNTQPKRKKH